MMRMRLPTAASLPVYWSGPPTGADVLHVAFVLNNAVGSPACFWGPPRLPVAPLNRSAKSLRALRLGEAERDEVAVVAGST
jgi:hypothetical protein